MTEGLADVGSAFVAGGDAAEACEPSQGAFDDPAVAAEPVGAVNATAGNARLDTAHAAGLAAGGVVVGLVGVQLRGASARPAAAPADGTHRVQHWPQEAAVVPVGRAQANGERDAVRVGQKMTLGARAAAIGRVRAGLFALLFATTAALSTAQRDQSTAFARPSRSSSRRQQVMPQPQPISFGSISQGRPDLSTNRMPVSAARSETGGRPPFGRGRGGSRGASSAHSVSGTSGLAMSRPAGAAALGSRFC